MSVRHTITCFSVVGLVEPRFLVGLPYRTVLYGLTSTSLTTDLHVSSLDNRNTVILVLLDLSATFDTVEHRLLLDKLYRIGIRGNAHCWMHSYLPERTQVVRVDKHTSRCVDLCFGVPEGSVLGPLLFTVYCLGLDDIFKRHQLKYHIICMPMTPSCTSNSPEISKFPQQLLLIAYCCAPPK